MSSVVVVWLVIGLLSTAMVVAVLAGLVRHVLVLLRTVRRFGDEVSPIAREIAEQTQRASSRSSTLGHATRPARPERDRVPEPSADPAVR